MSDELVQLDFSKVLDGWSISGLREGVLLVREENIATLLQASIGGEIFPYFITAIMLDDRDPDFWLVLLKRGDSMIEGDEDNAVVPM